MRVAILGLGNMGRGLAQRLAGKVDLNLGVRNTEAAQSFAADLPGRVIVTDQVSATENADVVVLALPYAAALEFAQNTDVLNGKIVVDITNPIKPDFSGLSFGFDSSAAEEIQKAAPNARVVKAFNTIFAQLFATSREATAQVQVFVSGDDADAVAKVEELVSLSGFAPSNAGGIDAARLIEPVGMLNIRYGYGLGKGTQIAPVWTSVAA